MKTKVLVPEDTEFDLLGQLAAPINVYRPSNLSPGDGSSALFLQSEQGALLRLAVDYDDVVFKFECFNISVEPASANESLSRAALLSTIRDWHRIKCCFRFESERPALPGEVRADKEQVVRVVGRRNTTANAVAACVSMVGLIFWSDVTNSPIAAVVKRPEDTVMLSLYRDPQQIEAFMQECEILDIEESSGAANAWRDNLFA